jgi:hypothetical protein
MDVLRKIRRISVRIEIVVSWGVTPSSLQIVTVLPRNELYKFQGVLKVEATPPYETFVTTYQNTRRNITEDRKLPSHCFGNLYSRS